MRASSVTAWRKKASRASTTRLNWPKISKDSSPKSCDHAATSGAATAGEARGEVGGDPLRLGAQLRGERRQPDPLLAVRVLDYGDENEADPGGGADGGLRCGVTGHRRAVDQRVLVRVGESPLPYGARDSDPAGEVGAGPGGRRVLGRGGPVGTLGGLAHGVVRIDDQGGQQFVTAGEVAVERRGHHAEFTCHGAQGELRRPFGRELFPRLVLDGGGDLDAGPFPGSPDSAHDGQSAMKRSTAQLREQCSCF